MGQVRGGATWARLVHHGPVSRSTNSREAAYVHGCCFSLRIECTAFTDTAKCIVILCRECVT
jgi:hypothetical protein